MAGLGYTFEQGIAEMVGWYNQVNKGLLYNRWSVKPFPCRY